MTTWADDQCLGVGFNKLALDEPDTMTLEEYHRWRDQTLFDDEPHRLPPQTVQLAGDWL